RSKAVPPGSLAMICATTWNACRGRGLTNSRSPISPLACTIGCLLSIKGTRPRGATPAEDQQRSAELLHSAKDRAENIMIVDLLRNDLGRVCRYGSVRVAAVCRLESYRFVHHLVSEVRGRLWPGLGPV